MFWCAVVVCVVDWVVVETFGMLLGGVCPGCCKVLSSDVSTHSSSELSSWCGWCELVDDDDEEEEEEEDDDVLFSANTEGVIK